ncbi:MAG: ABC transporter ATP-binding protein [Pseudobdellovibrionaceae bacterium]|nr:ABC transporter ATP-binding protein [Pseudobdellovibrionaceae bacterium]
MNTHNYGLAVKDLRKKLGRNQALDGMSLQFAPGVMHGLIGPEGAGKTTLMRCLMGLLRPDEGQIDFTANGQSVTQASLRSDMAYMPQQQSLYADLSIDEHLKFFKALYQIPDAEFGRKRAELLEVTRLTQFVDRPAGKLSGGMYKKLGLMCALLRSPRILLLDEPTNGVDPISRREFWELLYDLQANPILILVATAYMDEAERCGEVHLVHAGKTVAEGEPMGLLQERQVKSIDELFLKEAL